MPDVDAKELVSALESKAQSRLAKQLVERMSALTVPLVATQDSPDDLNAYTERFTGEERTIAVMTAYMGWNTAINVVRKIIEESLAEDSQ